ncbi:replication protein A 70 kDa DNA-binding subunit B-like [Silene latifolia]|uniref:replication protein A 70 kDa DNA-binding subunit B-like n=1 Tax=Silene latifolia TaxID=37657 RepID=UPI003D788615
MFVCKGTIIEIRTDVEWRYMSCTTCKSGLQEDKTCFQCNKLVQYPTQRYRIMTTISDGETSAKLVLFDKEAEKVIGKPITKLLDIYEQENGKERVFDILQQCIGKQHTFKVKVGMSKFGLERELKGQKTITSEEDEESKTMMNKGKEKATLEQEGPPRTPTKAGFSSQTPDKKEKRKNTEKPRRGEKDIKMEGSIANKRTKAQETSP